MEDILDDEFELDLIRGELGKKRKMAVLNKTKLTKIEMDQLFTGEELDDEE